MPEPLPDILTIDPATIESAVLRRLIAEVQQAALEAEEPSGLQAYNRSHNRHNRGPHPGRSYDRSHNRHNRGPSR